MKVDNFINQNSTPHIIETAEDFIINNKVFSKYTLEEDGQLNFFRLKEAAPNDYRYMPMKHLSRKDCDYTVCRSMVDNLDSSITYILYRNADVNYAAKLQKQEDGYYKEIATVKLDNIGSSQGDPGYYSHINITFDGQTNLAVLINDGFAIFNIRKSDFSLRKLITRKPIFPVEINQEDEYVRFIDTECIQDAEYNVSENTISAWNSINNKWDDTNYLPSIKYLYKLQDIIIPFININYFMNGYKLYTLYKEPDNSPLNKNGEYTAVGISGTVLFTHFTRSSKNVLYTHQEDTIIGETTSTYFGFIDNDSTICSRYSYRYMYSLNLSHILKDLNIHLYNRTNPDKYYEYKINGTSDKIFMDIFKDDSFLIIDQNNEKTNLILLSSEMDELIKIVLEPNKKFQICEKYDDEHFVLIYDDDECCVYEIDYVKKQINKVSNFTNIKAFSIDDAKNLWLINNTSFYIQNENTASILEAKFDKEQYTYSGTDISSTIKIRAINFLNKRIRTKIKITLDGPCVFGNGKKQATFYTSTDRDLIVAVTINGTGKCSSTIEEVE